MTDLRLMADQDGERLDQFLARSVEGLTRSAAQRLIEDGAVTCNGKAVKKNARTAVGDAVDLTLPDPEPVDVLPQDIPLDVVYEDADVIVVNKPVGMVVHPAPGHPDGTLVNALLYHCKIASPESTGSCGRASSTASTGTPRGSSSPPRTTPPTWLWRPSSRTTPCTAIMRRCAWGA